MAEPVMVKLPFRRMSSEDAPTITTFPVSRSGPCKAELLDVHPADAVAAHYRSSLF